MMLPTIHLNGTALETLRDEAEGAYTALEIAERVLGTTYPNARDYYPQGDGAHARAVEEHLARVAAIRKARSEISDLYAYLLEAGEI